LSVATYRGNNDEMNGDHFSSSGWLAFERALAHARDTAPAGVAGTDLSRFLVVFSDAVQDVLTGRPPAIDQPPATISTGHLIENVRRTFIELSCAGIAAEADQHTGARDALQILRAIGEVQAVLDQSDTNAVTREWIAQVGLGPTVEVAHDIRSPLTAILFLVDMLQSGRSGAVNAVQASQLGVVYSAALGLNHLACDLIDFVRGADHLADDAPVPFSVRALLRSVCDIVQPMAEERGLTIELSTPDHDARLGNPGALSRILLNLATNALKFTSRGSVGISARAVGRNGVEFSVWDSGDGIPQHAFPDLFQPFRRSTQGQACFSSAGLGLSICHRLVTALGSELRVTTAQGVGTHFRFELDLVPVDGITEPPQRPE
jgi:signal transduction histidine kinase